MKFILFLALLSVHFTQSNFHHKVLKEVQLNENSIVCIEKNPNQPFDKAYLTLGGFISGFSQLKTNQEDCKKIKLEYGIELTQGDRFLSVLENQTISIQTKTQMLNIKAQDIFEIKNLGQIYQIKTKNINYLGFILNDDILFHTPFGLQKVPVGTLKYYFMPNSHKEKSFMELNSFWDPIFSSVFFLKKAGTFEMGKDTLVPIFLDESPAHKVTITQDFYIAKKEVTIEEWLKISPDNNFVIQNDCPKCPISNANWNQVNQFIDQLNQMQNQVTYSLPTEAEWEYVAKQYQIEDITPKDQLNEVCEYQSKNLFCDLFSGVWEWTKDDKMSYIKSHAIDPVVLKGSNRKVYRGGSNFSQKRVRNHSYRGSASKTKNDHTIGFRLVLRRRQ